VFDYLRDECFVFFLGVLFVQDAVGFGAEADAGEEVTGAVASISVLNFVASMCKRCNFISRSIYARINSLKP